MQGEGADACRRIRLRLPASTDLPAPPANQQEALELASTAMQASVLHA